MSIGKADELGSKFYLYLVDFWPPKPGNYLRSVRGKKVGARNSWQSWIKSMSHRPNSELFARGKGIDPYLSRRE